MSTEAVADDAAGALPSEGRRRRRSLVPGQPAAVLPGSVSLGVAARCASSVIVARGDGVALRAGHERVLLGIGDRDVGSPGRALRLPEDSRPRLSS
ncbi:hypothetical protein ACWCWD_01710 [Streptomyces sp. NPDC001493]